MDYRWPVILANDDQDVPEPGPSLLDSGHGVVGELVDGGVPLIDAYAPRASVDASLAAVARRAWRRLSSAASAPSTVKSGGSQGLRPESGVAISSRHGNVQRHHDDTGRLERDAVRIND